ncbi:hypothetical protein DYD21_05040 [Rhodohalobacter sp. SW132]|uniref:hypothetical protein n=1 Tax=Rhodohalobacter sp. SW132 TaxID=2293433 RepID=UPI000E2619D0|nr:hypothetical protein [Rhodohalobacter sp. SW132]REL37985.1 hypothetical protein DYD21_05040 [Rhodohalobacter sp. SW132]
MDKFFNEYKMPLSGGLLTAVFSGAAVYLLGNLSGFEAIQLIETTIPRISTLFNTIILASATILALILTLLGISSSSNSKLKKYHYKQVLSLARFASFLFILTLVFFQFLNIPFAEAENIPTSSYSTIYWLILFVSSLLSGMMVAVILMLYKIIHNIILIVGLGQEHALIDNENDEVENKEDMDRAEDQAEDDGLKE